MSDEKLSALIETLKKQGVESGEALGRQITESAQKQAEEIIGKAEGEARAILERAKNEADLELKRLKSSMEIAAIKFLTQLKHSVEESFLKIPLLAEVEKNMADPVFFKNLLTTFVETYAARNPGEAISLRLPVSTAEEVGTFAVELLKRKYGPAGEGRDLVIRDPNLKIGFLVDLGSGNVSLDFTEEAYLSKFLEFMTPEFRNFFISLKIGSQTES
ncbi:MAG: hypothetical protein AB1896_06915 [Thermodesulfobacteriota bacterium]